MIRHRTIPLLKIMVLQHFKKLENSKVLIGDNLNNHITVNAIQECNNNNIKFVLLSPNSTHLLQPLDVASFRPLKTSRRKILEACKLQHRGVLPKAEFSRLLKQGYSKHWTKI